MKLRAKHRFHISIVSFLCVGTLAASLCSCEKKETQDYAFTGTNGDASSLGVISVQVREDGSGTRNQFSLKNISGFPCLKTTWINTRT